MNMHSLQMNIQKELWEYKRIFVWLPVILASLIVLIPVLNYLLGDGLPINWQQQLNRISQQQDNMLFSQIVFGFISALFAPFMIVAFIVQLYYFTACFFDERRDLSIVFWRSLPVPDSQTVGVKLLVGAIILPAIFMLAATMVLLLFVLVALIACTVLSVSQNIDIWGIWLSGEWISNFLITWSSLLPLSLWLLPVYAWLMLASIYAKKAPFLLAILPVTILVIVEAIIVEYFNLASPYFTVMLVNYFDFSNAITGQYTSISAMPINAIMSKVTVGTFVLGGSFIYATYWLRVNRGQ
ncbi:ABC transporter permease [Thalassotalea sp. 1_MG-2023]|uniref:ABC transporter permease n=1 Tax=Thalassotalea sp. 1_MG-2023 TaxID=3062680 RepID=UPI0026E403D0|nr:ABC transporter permease [Thalassotalea sp. 1_MG-2023]MDO6428771.1 ABC transporter permease [Thalassotalea sp. 1_MG-2023]